MDGAGLSRWTVAVLCLTGIVGLHARIAAGQSIAVTGRVVDALSGRAVAGVQLTIGSRTIVTDAEGRFQLDVSAGRWEIDVKARDYLPRTIAVDAGSQSVAPIEIQLVPRGGFAEHLEVTAPEPPPEGPASLPLTFNPETVERFELLAGGFGARYGDRLSGCEHRGPDLVVLAAEGRTGRRFSPPANVRPALQVSLVRRARSLRISDCDDGHRRMVADRAADRRRLAARIRKSEHLHHFPC
jgi:Carboxypeptidase regulatory-like domain